MYSETILGWSGVQVKRMKGFLDDELGFLALISKHSVDNLIYAKSITNMYNIPASGDWSVIAEIQVFFLQENEVYLDLLINTGHPASTLS